MTAILTDAAAVANATARAITFQSRDPEAYIFDNSAWMTGFVGGDYRWLSDGGVGGRNLDARTLFFYMATVNTPAMAMKMVGLGSQYAILHHDSNGDVPDGAKNYRLRIPADVPAKDFSGVASSASSILRRFIGDILRRPVRFQRGDALQLRPCSAVGEYPSSLDRGTWAMIFGIGTLENWEDFLSALHCEPCHDSQFIRGQVEVAHSNRHLPILATIGSVGSRSCGVTPSTVASEVGIKGSGKGGE
jgi:hypothetical protein